MKTVNIDMHTHGSGHVQKLVGKKVVRGNGHHSVEREKQNVHVFGTPGVLASTLGCKKD